MKIVVVILFALMLAQPLVRGAIIYSGVQDVAIPLDFDGVYLNVVSGSTITSEPASWNSSPWINPFFGGVYIGTSNLLNPVITGADQIEKLTFGSMIDGSSSFATGESGSSTHIGSAADQFQLNVPGYLGFRFQTTLGGSTNYGWMQVTINNAGEGSIHDWAYDNSGHSILAGALAVPEPGRMSCVFVALIVMSLRRRRLS